jgi:hypothetical protein
MSHPVHLILSAGTRVVTRNDTNRIGGQAGPAPNDATCGDCNARSARLMWATDSQGLGSQIKWKHAMHLMRLLLSGISALREDELRVRLDEHRPALLTIKRAEQSWPEVNAWRLRLHKEFDEAFASTQLPERPDYGWANEFLLKARRKMIVCGES